MLFFVTSRSLCRLQMLTFGEEALIVEGRYERDRNDGFGCNGYARGHNDALATAQRRLRSLIGGDIR